MSDEQFPLRSSRASRRNSCTGAWHSRRETVKARLGIAVDRIGGGVALSVRNDVSGYFSKALGFGFTEPVTADLVDRVIAFYERNGSQGATLQIAPEVLPGYWERHPRQAWIAPQRALVEVGVCDRDATPIRVNCGPVR